MARPEVVAAGTLIVLDRDGVLNRLLDNPAEPRPDSPMRPSEVEVFPWVPAVLRALTDAGFGLAIASNQPAAAKGRRPAPSSRRRTRRFCGPPPRAAASS